MANLLELNKEDLEKLKQYCHNQKFNLTEEDFKNEENIMKKLNSQQYFEYRLMKKKLVEADRFDKCDVSISCNVHGMINLHPVLKNIIDTPQFQRLRRLRQLGPVCFVYPTAMHTRFEHSIGVSHLAGQLVNQLAEVQPELNITKKDILCVKIAGLCHDLGHGPFSHTFDRFIKMATEVERNHERASYELPDNINKNKSEVEWTHEQASCELLDTLFHNNLKVKQSLERCGIDETDITFIKEMIIGIKNESTCDNWPYKGRPREKGFLYEIVANNRSGLDVDKLDYLSRDCLNLGLSLVSANFDHKRIMHHLRVNKVGKNFVLSTRDKENTSMLKVFELRRQLFRTAYLHKTTVAVEYMLLDVMLLANPYITTLGYSLSEVVKNLDAYCKLDDETLLSMIRTSSCTEPDMVRAQELLCRIEQRDLYQLIGETVYMHGIQSEQPPVSKKYKQEVVQKDLQDLLPDKAKDIVVVICVVHLGMRDQSPADYATYYTKTQHVVSLDKRPWLDPISAMEEVIRVYSKEKSAELTQETQQLRIDAFIRWCEMESLPTPNKNGSPIKSSQSLKSNAAATSESSREAEKHAPS